jgi:hypothetical protein
MQIRNAAISILTSMVHFYEKIGAPEAINVVYNQMKKIFCPRNRYAVQIREEFQKDYVKKGVELAKKYAREMMETKR